MLVGETVTIQRVETRAAAFNIISAVLSVLNPDGTVYSPSPAVAVTHDATNSIWTLSANVTPVQGGALRAAWSYVDSSGEIIKRLDDRFATWTGATDFLRTRLQ